VTLSVFQKKKIEGHYIYDCYTVFRVAMVTVLQALGQGELINSKKRCLGIQQKYGRILPYPISWFLLVLR
jgi:hypothetical protein